LFATRNEYSGLIYGSSTLLKAQIVAVLATIIYAFVVTFAIAKVVDLTIGLRIREGEEYVGLDISQHGEVAYS